MSHHSDQTGHPTKRVLNLKAAGILICVAVLFTLLTRWLHADQVIRTAAYLKDTAAQALQDGDHNRAFDLFEQYLVLNPKDDFVEEQVSQLLEEHGTSVRSLTRAFQINERLLRRDRSRDDLRLRQIRISDRLGRYSDAAVHLRTLREKNSDLAQVWHFSGVVAQDIGDFAAAQEYFSKAVTLKDPLPESFEHLANLLTNEAHDPNSAERLLQRLISELDSSESRKIRATWFLNQQRPQEAIADLMQVMAREPKDVRANAMLLKALRLAESRDHLFDGSDQYEEMIGRLNRVLSDNPDASRLRLYLSAALWATGQRGAAISNLEYGIERAPREFELHEVLFDYLITERQIAHAQSLFARIPERALGRGRYEFMRGRLLMAQQQWQPAINAFDLAIGLAQDDPQILSRGRICIALCRRESGDNVAAMDTYRALIQANPDFEGGRLGMASAYLRADQLPLAIAEYRQLLHVEGVPGFLANLMIQDTLTQPPQSRDWTEVEQLLRDSDPLVTDEVQRILLQVDLLFAQGHPARAMDHLDRAARRMPDRPEIQRASQRLSSVHGESLNGRILQVLEEDPRNMEAHISVLRLQVARQDTADMVNWLDRLMNGSLYEKLGEGERLMIISEAATLVADTEIATRGAGEQTRVLLNYAGESRRRLASSSPRNLFRYVRFLARHRSTQVAMTVAEAMDTSIPIQDQAECWLECLRHGGRDAAVRERVDRELIKLIRAEPANLALRMIYADSRILLERYDEAEQLLSQLADFDRDSGRAQGRLSWLALLVRGDRQKALQLSEQAWSRSPTNPDVRSIRGLALAETGRAGEALNIFQSIPAQERTAASYLFEARALFLAGQTARAAELVRDLNYRSAELANPELELLRRLQQELDVAPRQMTRR